MQAWHLETKVAVETTTRKKIRNEESTNLSPRSLSSNGQPKRMSSTTVSPSLLQALNIIEHLSSQVIFDLHIRQHSGQVEDLLVRQLADAAGWVDVKAGQKAG